MGGHERSGVAPRPPAHTADRQLAGLAALLEVATPQRKPIGKKHSAQEPAPHRQAAGLTTLIQIAHLVHRRAKPRQQRPQARVVVLIPAHNEAASTAGTIRSLRRQARPPDEITVICDNCTDDTAGISLRNGASVITTTGNKGKKAGALNQGLRATLPDLASHDLVLTIDADSRLHRNWIRNAARTLRQSRRVGAVCGVVSGEAGHGLIGQLQRNEYVRGARTIRRMRHVRVLSGCGTVFRAGALRKIAALRGRVLPGRRGDCFNTGSITEDYEITLALKAVGFTCLFSQDSVAITELMPTWRDLFRQRVRWQRGTLSDLRRYGWGRATWRDWMRQLIAYLSYIAVLVCWAVISSSFASGATFDPRWGLSVLGISLAEIVWTVRRAGWRGVLLAALIIPELGYVLFEAAYLAWAAAAEYAGQGATWNHIEASVS